jgi:class 3 adenylate cyclase
MVVQEPFAVTTFLFTDIEGSTRLWEHEPERMRPALARHDALARSAVEATRGVIVKMTGDGVHAAFGDPLDAVSAALQFQQALIDPGATHGIPLQVRCGLHLGVVEARDNDFFGSVVNRAARIMGAAHGGQVLL